MRTYLRLLRFAAPYKLRIALAILCMALLSFATAAYANLLGPALEFLFTGEVKSLASLRNFVPGDLDFDAWLGSVDRARVLGLLPWVIERSPPGSGKHTQWDRLPLDGHRPTRGGGVRLP